MKHKTYIWSFKEEEIQMSCDVVVFLNSTMEHPKSNLFIVLYQPTEKSFE